MAGLPRSIYDDFDPAQPAEPMSASTAGSSIYDEFEKNLELQDIRDEAAAQTGSGLGKEFRSGFYGTVGSAAKGVGALVGSETIEDYGDRTNAYAQGLSEGSGMTQSMYDIEDVGDAVSYAGKTIANAAGSTIPTLVGGGGAGALAARGLGAVASRGAMTGAFGVSAAAGTGQNIEAQEDQAGERDLLSAASLGAAGGALEVAGGLTGGALKALAGQGMTRGVLRQAGRTAIEEAAVETGQQFTEELSRRAVDENFDVLGSESRARLGEAAVAGALGGGALGGGISAITREKKSAVPSSNPEVAGTDPTTTAEADAKGEPLQITGPPREPARIEDQRNWRREEETITPLLTPVQPDGKPRQDVLDLFTGATPETLRPVSEGDVIRAVRGDLPLDAPVRQITTELMATLNGGKAKGKKATVLPVTDRVRAAYELLDTLADKFAASPNIKPEKQEGYLAALARAAEIVQAYELNLEALGVPRVTGAPTVDQMAGPGVPIEKPLNAAQAGFNSMIRPSEDIGQATVDANIAQQNMLAQQQAEQQRAAELGMLEQQEADAAAMEEQVKSVEEQQTLQAEENARIAQEAMLPAQRQELLDSIIKGPKPQLTPLRAFMQGLSKLDPNAQPTPEELSALATYSSLSYPDKVKEAEKAAPKEKLVPKAPQNEGLLEPVTVKGKTNKRQLRAQQARAEATALVPEAQQSPELKTMLKALEDTATSIDTIFKSLLNTTAAEPTQPSLFEGADPRVQPSQPRGFRQYVQNKIAAQDAKFEKQLADLKAAVEAQAQPAPAPAPKQDELFDTKGKPTKQAQGLTKDQVAERVADMEKAIPNDGLGAAKKLAVVPEIKALIETAPGEAVMDLMATVSRPDISMQDAVQLTQIVKDRFAPRPTPAVAPEATEASPAPAEEAESAVLDEENPGVNPLDGAAFSPLSPAARTRALERGMGDALKLWTEGWKNPPAIELYDPNNPRDPRVAAFYDKVPFAGLYDRDNKKVYLNIYAFDTAEQFGGTLYHEALGHYGLDQLYGKRRNEVLMQIYRGNPEIRREVAAMRKEANVSFGSEFENQLYYTEEVLVSKFDKGELELTPTFWQKLRDLITEFARKMGMPARAYTNAEIIAIMHAARDTVIKGPPKSPTPRPSRPFFGQRFAAQPVASPAPSTMATAPEILRSRSMNLRGKLAKKGIPEPFINLAVTASDMTQNIKLGTLLGRNLVDEAVRQGLPSAKRLFDIQQAVMAKSNEYVKTLDQLVVDAMNLDGRGESFRGVTPKRDALNKYLQKSTISGKWGYQPTWKTEQVKIDPVAKRETDAFRAKYPDAFAVADAMFQYSDTARTDLQTAVTKFIEQETAGDLANALTPSERKAIEDRKQRELKLFNKLVPRLDGPYAPLSRFGQYAAIAKSARFVELENKIKVGQADKDEIAELGNLRTDANHYAVFFRDSQADADNVLLEKLQKNPAFKGGQLYSSVRNEVFEQIGESPIMQMQRFKDMMVKELGETDKLGRKTTREIEGIIKDLYIRTLAETSARQHDQYREGIDGADEDMVRAFAQKGRSDAHILAQITDRHEIGQVMQTMISKESSVRDAKYQDRKRVLREILMRHKQEMLAEETPVQDKLMAMSSLYHLAMSPRYYLMNSLQPWMVSAPYLAGRHGVQAYGTLYNTYKSLAPQMKSKDFWKGKVDLMKLQGVTDAEREALKQMQLNGLLELGQQYDQGYWEASDGPGRFMSEATHTFRTLSGQIEYINRVSSALAAYRLSGGKVDAMTDILARTQFDYSSRNQPRYFNALPKVITQFRKYQLGQLALWLGMLGDAKTSPEARRMLAYMTGQLAVVTGAVGLPAAQLFGVIGSAIFGEEDEPIDGEKWLTDLVGEGVAARGIGTLIGVELANGLGLGTLVNPFPFLNYSELDSRDGVRDAAFTILGPSAGLVDKAQRGGEAAQQGEYLRALGEFLPSGVTNALRAYEMATRGYEKKNGDMLLSPEEIGEVNVMLQALGFAPSVKLTAQRVNGQKVQYEEHFKQRTSMLKRTYAQAQEERDVEAMRELEAKWDALQKTKEQYGFKKTPRAELLRARAEQKKREKNTVGGVQVTTRNREFVERALAE